MLLSLSISQKKNIKLKKYRTECEDQSQIFKKMKGKLFQSTIEAFLNLQCCFYNLKMLSLKSYTLFCYRCFAINFEKNTMSFVYSTTIAPLHYAANVLSDHLLFASERNPL